MAQVTRRTLPPLERVFLKSAREYAVCVRFLYDQKLPGGARMYTPAQIRDRVKLYWPDVDYRKVRLALQHYKDARRDFGDDYQHTVRGQKDEQQLFRAMNILKREEREEELKKLRQEVRRLGGNPTALAAG